MTRIDKAHDARCPVLMYHKVGQPVAGAGDRFLNISGPAFHRQISMMMRLGYQCRTFAEVADALSQGKTLPRRTFAITFDDGYRCIEEVAAPILAQLALPATVFAVPKYVGKTNGWDADNGKPLAELMDWSGLRRLAGAGWEIGNHTWSHRHLGLLADTDAETEIREGKEQLEAELGVKIVSFCYPYGHLNTRTPGIVQSCGLRSACTTRSGLARSGYDPFLQPRVKVYEESLVGLLIRILIRPHFPEIRRRHGPDTPAPRRHA